MQNFVKILIASFFFELINFSSSSYAIADQVIKREYTNAYCLESLIFRECNFNDGIQMIGSMDSTGNWNGNVKHIDGSRVGYFLYRSNDIGYGKIYLDNGYYVGDLSSNGDFYGRGSIYFHDGSKASYQNWHEDIRTGYQIYSDGSKTVGNFDSDYNYISKTVLHKDFQIKLNNMELLASSVEVDFNKDYSKFYPLKNKFLSQNEKLNKKNDIQTSSGNSNTSAKNQKVKSNDSQQNLTIALIILAIVIVFFWIKAKNSKIINSTTDTSGINPDKESHNNSSKIFKNFSISDSKKLFSFGVAEEMTITQACKQLRKEYFRHQTLTNSKDVLKKTLSQKSMNQIISLRGKLNC